MTETKVSISKLRAVHLSKLASSPVSLGQLHQLTTKPAKNLRVAEVDPELLQTVKDKILKKTSLKKFKAVTGKSNLSEIILEDDKCALIFMSHLSNLEDKFKTKQYIDMIKESYYNFQKATLYDQKLQDLRYAINEGVNQEFNLNEISSSKTDLMSDNLYGPLPKGAHAVFRELFVDNHHLDSYDQELMSHITNMQ